MSSTESLKRGFDDIVWVTCLQIDKGEYKDEVRLNLDGQHCDLILLHQDQCGNHLSNVRCRNTCNLSHPFCDQCTLKYQNLKIYNYEEEWNLKAVYQESEATEEMKSVVIFKSGDRISEIIGEYLSFNLSLKRYKNFFTNTKGKSINLGHTYDIPISDKTSIVLDSIRWRSPIFYSKKSKLKEECNALFVMDHAKKTIAVVAFKEIKNNENIVIYADYNVSDHIKLTKCKTFRMALSEFNKRTQPIIKFTNH